MKTTIGITEVNRQNVATELAKIVADETVLYTKTKNAHWNIEGADFYDKHLFFEAQFGQLVEMIDRVAERMRTLGHYTPATLKSFLELTHLTEENKGKNSSLDFMRELLEDHESLIIVLRGLIKSFSHDFHDEGSSDFVTGLMETHEKMAWFLRAHLNN